MATSVHTRAALTQHACMRAQVTPLINELGRTRLEVNVKVKAGFSKQLFALAVVVSIPVPDTTAKAELQTTIGAGPMSTWADCAFLMLLQHSDTVTQHAHVLVGRASVQGQRGARTFTHAAMLVLLLQKLLSALCRGCTGS